MKSPKQASPTVPNVLSNTLPWGHMVVPKTLWMVDGGWWGRPPYHPQPGGWVGRPTPPTRVHTVHTTRDLLYAVPSLCAHTTVVHRLHCVRVSVVQRVDCMHHSCPRCSPRNHLSCPVGARRASLVVVMCVRAGRHHHNDPLTHPYTSLQECTACTSLLRRRQRCPGPG